MTKIHTYNIFNALDALRATIDPPPRNVREGYRSSRPLIRRTFETDTIHNQPLREPRYRHLGRRLDPDLQ
jgi:hypothetical protein